MCNKTGSLPSHVLTWIALALVYLVLAAVALVASVAATIKVIDEVNAVAIQTTDTRTTVVDQFCNKANSN